MAAEWISVEEMGRVASLCRVFDELYKYGSEDNAVALDYTVFNGVKVFDVNGLCLGTIGMDESGRFALYFPTKDD